MSILLSKTLRKERNRLVVIGLDGLPLALAKKLGTTLPGLGRLAENATSVEAELPELSPVNWTSFFTGVGPEKHGIFGFARMNPDTYISEVSNYNHVAVTNIFHRLGEAGYISRVINLPNTYPAPAINGMLVSGFVAEELKHAAYPPFLAGQLAEAGYQLEADTTRGASDPEYLFGQLQATLESRLKALDIMWPDLAWDLFVMVFTETDRLFHFLLPAVTNENHPHHQQSMDIMRKLDSAVQVVLERFDALPSPKRLMVLADHGFTELKTEVDLNAWLRKQELLSLTGPAAGEWDSSVIDGSTQAFALDPGRIYIHTRDRFTRSGLPASERPRLKRDIQRGLEALTLDGEQVIEKVFDAEELYPETEHDHAPDLVCKAFPGFDLKAKFNRNEVFGMFGRYGTHTAHGAIFYDSQGSRPQRMRDTGKAILEHFGLNT